MLIIHILLWLLPLLALAAPDFYKILGVKKDASDRELKKAYKQLSKKFHPDKNPGNEDANKKFIEVSEAYEALSNEESRKIYDRYGYEGYQKHQQGGQGGGHHHDPFDLFSRFFGGGGHAGHGHGQRRGHNMEAKVSVPLKDFYTGNRVEFQITKQQICEECEGSGSQDGQTETCDLCGGRGMRIVKHMLAPGIFQQVQTVCDRCGGKGNKIKHPCKVCQGQRVVKKPVSHYLEVDKGVPNGMRVNFENEADESPDWVAGDLIITVDELPPQPEKNTEHVDGWYFRRRGKDLIHKEVLSLREALLGDWERTLTHLDGHEVKLGRKKGVVVQPGHVDVIKGEGMPLWEHEGFGNLIVEYTVVFPDQMQSGMRKDIEAVFEKWRKKIGVNIKDEL